MIETTTWNSPNNQMAYTSPQSWRHSWLSYSVTPYWYGSIPINTIFRGMNIHLPAILMFTRGTRFWHTAISSAKFRKGFASLQGSHRVPWQRPRQRRTRWHLHPEVWCWEPPRLRGVLVSRAVQGPRRARKIWVPQGDFGRDRLENDEIIEIIV